ncbi:DNA polymerase III subunit gamma and tau [Arthrobacter sp.]|uniref:DNA polymerase III subunit gamma and tau n=1 Tax=Arthrobacter sp. TaxID=1667 RepID=UPI0035C73C52
MSVPIGRVFSVTVTTALYRRYRPDSFADVIGQEHVTEPLMTALRKNRVNHAYLFSGPRGCGKTTSARILARCLNCVQGPTDTPCGKCPSCIELARGGAGSLDVIEIDAASHGGVDDARDLRERATYAPVRDRYKIFIIDEAHMVTSAGFNALLKIVEEPPEHIKFIFATTEPDKVIGTIRSRTHHYPFRLVPPEPLMAYLELLCKQENVPVAPGVLSLVIRAGGGSVRDSLSVLDQLMAGAGPNGLDYELAVALLGYTHASLLDDVVDAIAASDAATVFRAVDRVIQTGHDPRRFVEDLLERFRDLIIVKAMPESAQSILRGMPADQIARLQNQAHNLGSAELSRAADVTNTALTEMTGATSPRLHLELLCARILLPSTEQTERGIAARIDRVERRLSFAGNDPATPAADAAGIDAKAASGARQRPPAVPAQPTESPSAAPQSAAPQVVAAPEVAAAPAVAAASMVEAAPSAATPPTAASAGSAAAARAASPAAPSTEAASPPSPAESASSAAPGPGASSSDVEVLRRAWPDILQTLTKIKRSTWALVEPNAQVARFDGQVLTIAFTTSGLAGAFGRADHSDNLRQAIHKTIGIDCQIEAVAGGSKSAASAEPNPKAPTNRGVPVASTDADWGLDPATASAPAQTPAAAPAPAPAAVPSPAVANAAADANTPTAPGHPSTDESRTPGAAKNDAASVNMQDSGGSYSYPDDDWGPPRDEDAPPPDDEPPMDWEPPADPGRHTPLRQPAANAETKSRPGPPPTSKAPITGPDPASEVQRPATSDPWAHAREQAPGVWVIAAESNVGSQNGSADSPVSAAASLPSPATASNMPAESPAPAPRYEPAAAQVPQPVGAMAGPAGVSATSPAPAPPKKSSITSPPAPTKNTPSAYTVSAATSPGETAVRQSLYQRLSSSPEAEAGRAKAPARTADTGAAFVQDVPSADDETIEESGVFGRAAVERILGGKLVEERSLDGSPLPPRF